MTTLVERLRSFDKFLSPSGYLVCQRAADEIERLTAELAEAKSINNLLNHETQSQLQLRKDAEAALAAKSAELERVERKTAMRCHALIWTVQSLEIGRHRQEARDLARRRIGDAIWKEFKLDETALAEATTKQQGKPYTIKTAAADMVLVPMEPTPPMLEAGLVQYDKDAATAGIHVRRIYKAMLAAVDRQRGEP